jgi:hypothetical protein
MEDLFGPCGCGSREDDLTHIGETAMGATWCGKSIDGILITKDPEVTCLECLKIIKQRSRPV